MNKVYYQSNVVFKMDLTFTINIIGAGDFDTILFNFKVYFEKNGSP